MILTRFSFAFAAVLCAGAAARLTAQAPPAPARVTLQLDSTTVDRFEVRTFDLGVTAAATRDSTSPASSATMMLVKSAGPYTGDLVRLSASGQHVPFATVEALDSLGSPTLTLRLYDVSVASDHVALSTAREALEQQRIGEDEALAQLTTDFQQARRDQATTEELAKSRGASPQDIDRARERSAELARRLDLARERQSLIARQLASQGLLDETLVLEFGRIEIDSPAPGGKAQWDFATPRPAGKPRLAGSSRGG